MVPVRLVSVGGNRPRMAATTLLLLLLLQLLPQLLLLLLMLCEPIMASDDGDSELDGAPRDRPLLPSRLALTPAETAACSPPPREAPETLPIRIRGLRRFRGECDESVGRPSQPPPVSPLPSPLPTSIASNASRSKKWSTIVRRTGNLR